MGATKIARGAESYVESLLLRAGWNVWRPLVDDGIDMIATRTDQAPLRIQVKSTCAIRNDGSCRFDLRKKDANGRRHPRSWDTVDLLVFVCGRKHVWAMNPQDCAVSAIHLRPETNGYWHHIFSEATT